MKRIEAVAGILKRVGQRDYDISTFNNRLLAQKLIFIIQEVLDLNFGYNFNLYLRGPYSSQFTKDFYEIKNTSEYKEVEIENQEGELLLNELSNVINEYTSDVGILELTSSLLYLNKLGTGNNIEHLIKKLKPGFSEEQYRLSLELFEQLRIIRRR